MPFHYHHGSLTPGEMMVPLLIAVQPGSIILLHVMPKSRVESRRALPAIIQGLEERGYDFATVSELLTLSPGPMTAVVEME